MKHSSDRLVYILVGVLIFFVICYYILRRIVLDAVGKGIVELIEHIVR